MEKVVTRNNYNWAPIEIREFTVAFDRFNASRPKSLKQAEIVFGLFDNGGEIRTLIPWTELITALSWDGDIYEDSLNSRKSTLAKRLRDICLEMSHMIDPLIRRPYNHRNICIISIKKKVSHLAKSIKLTTSQLKIGYPIK